MSDKGALVSVQRAVGYYSLASFCIMLTFSPRLTYLVSTSYAIFVFIFECRFLYKVFMQMAFLCFLFLFYIQQ